MINFLIEHYEWVFSGIGVFLLQLFILNKLQKPQKSDNRTVNTSNNKGTIHVNQGVNIRHLEVHHLPKRTRYFKLVILGVTVIEVTLAALLYEYIIKSPNEAHVIAEESILGNVSDQSNNVRNTNGLIEKKASTENTGNVKIIESGMAEPELEQLPHYDGPEPFISLLKPIISPTTINVNENVVLVGGVTTESGSYGKGVASKNAFYLDKAAEYWSKLPFEISDLAYISCHIKSGENIYLLQKDASFLKFNLQDHGSEVIKSRVVFFDVFEEKITSCFVLNNEIYLVPKQNASFPGMRFHVFNLENKKWNTFYFKYDFSGSDIDEISAFCYSDNFNINCIYDYDSEFNSVYYSYVKNKVSLNKSTSEITEQLNILSNLPRLRSSGLKAKVIGSTLFFTYRDAIYRAEWENLIEAHKIALFAEGISNSALAIGDDYVLAIGGFYKDSSSGTYYTPTLEVFKYLMKTVEK